MYSHLCTRIAFCICALGLCTSFLAPSTSFGQWDNDNGDQDWDNPINWAGDVFPSGANAIINIDAPGMFPIISATPTSGTPSDVIIGDGGGTAGRLDLRAGMAGSGASNWTFVGRGGNTGTFNIADTSTSGGGITGFGTGSGSYTTDILWMGGADFNDNGVGVMNINTTGTLSSTIGGGGGLILAGGWDGGIGDATVNLENGTVNVAAETWVGRAGTGVWNQTGGTLNSDSFLVVGREGGGAGNYTAGDGTLNLSGGVVNAAVVSGFGTIASFGVSQGEVNISGGIYNVGTGSGIGQIVGERGSGAFNIIGSTGMANILGDLYVGLTADGNDETGVGTIGFTADASGIGSISVSGDVNLSSNGDFLAVDLSAYTGPYADIILIDGTTSQGEFVGLSQGSLVTTGFSGGDFTIDYSVAGDVWLRTVVIPEPSSLAVLIVASLGLTRRRRT